jgi:hypothetical protein
MFKNLIIGVLFLFSANLLYSQVELPAVFKLYIKINENPKRIKDAKIKRYTEVADIKGKQDTVRINAYDTNGNIIYEKIVSIASNTNDKNITISYTYTYDGARKLIQKIDSTGKAYRRITLSYDDIGNLIQEKEHNNNGIVIRDASYEYDELSRLIESKELNIIYDCKSGTLYKYDSYNNLVSMKIERSCKDGPVEKTNYKYVYNYDKKGNIIEKQVGLIGGSYKTETFKYDNKGNMVQSYEELSKDSYKEYTYGYDNDNRKSQIDKKEVYGIEIKQFSEQFKYDNKGNLIEDKYVDADGNVISLHTYVYEYY